MTPPHTHDGRCLRRFLQDRRCGAFEELVQRHIGMVYASALRQVRKRDVAEDVTQAVFIVLLKKAEGLVDHPTLAGWLLKVTRYASLDAMRKESTKDRHERAAAGGRPDCASDESSSVDPWNELSPQLDEAMSHLSTTDRDCVALRYFEDLTFKQIAVQLNLTEESARKRVTRAVDKLRGALGKKGITLPAALIGVTLASNAQAATAPALLTQAVLAQSCGATANMTSLAIAKGVMKMLAWTKTTVLAGAAIAVMILGAGTLVLNRDSVAHAEPSPETHATPAPQAPAATGDAYPLYLQAADLIKVDCPASSNLEYPGYPPFGQAWEDLSKKAWELNAPARALVHQARSESAANWPDDPKLSYFNKLRELANQTGDAAVYAQVHLKRDDESLALIADARHLAKLIQKEPKAQGLIRFLVGQGIEALTANRLMIVAPGLSIQTLEQRDAVRALINDLLDQQTPDEQIANAMLGEPAAATMPFNKQIIDPSLNRAKETARRVNMERTFAAMSLACQLYKSEKGTWPGKAEDLVPAFLPKVPTDPWGDGKQTFEYALIKAGLPDGGDRPLVYCRFDSVDGLMYRVDRPMYEYNIGDGSDRPVQQQLHIGQARDVSRWSPKPNTKFPEPPVDDLPKSP